MDKEKREIGGCLKSVKVKCLVGFRYEGFFWGRKWRSVSLFEKLFWEVFYREEISKKSSSKLEYEFFEERCFYIEGEL